MTDQPLRELPNGGSRPQPDESPVVDEATWAEIQEMAALLFVPLPAGSTGGPVSMVDAVFVVKFFRPALYRKVGGDVLGRLLCESAGGTYKKRIHTSSVNLYKAGLHIEPRRLDPSISASPLEHRTHLDPSALHSSVLSLSIRTFSDASPILPEPVLMVQDKAFADQVDELRIERAREELREAAALVLQANRRRMIVQLETAKPFKLFRAGSTIIAKVGKSFDQRYAFQLLSCNASDANAIAFANACAADHARIGRLIAAFDAFVAFHRGFAQRRASLGLAGPSASAMQEPWYDARGLETEAPNMMSTEDSPTASEIGASGQPRQLNFEETPLHGNPYAELSDHSCPSCPSCSSGPSLPPSASRPPVRSGLSRGLRHQRVLTQDARAAGTRPSSTPPLPDASVESAARFQRAVDGGVVESASAGGDELSNLTLAIAKGLFLAPPGQGGRTTVKVLTEAAQELCLDTSTMGSVLTIALKIAQRLFVREGGLSLPGASEYNFDTPANARHALQASARRRRGSARAIARNW
jgi:hypothetical protein